MQKTATTVAAIVTIAAGMFYLTNEIGKSIEQAKIEHREQKSYEYGIAYDKCTDSEAVQKARDKELKKLYAGLNRKAETQEREMHHKACMQKAGYQ